MRDDLGKRMKENYEFRTRQFLPRRTNTIIRLDGKAFHTFTRGFEKPFDDGLIDAMNYTLLNLCQNIQGTVIGYTQSDEITLFLQDYKKRDTDAWYDGNVQKITSISASIATAYFNKYIRENLGVQKLALFDSRVFTVPELVEVENAFLWRQKDCVRNSISMVAQSLYSPKELNGKDQNQMQEMIFQKGLNWNDLSAWKKRGRFAYKTEEGWEIPFETIDILKERERFTKLLTVEKE